MTLRLGTLKCFATSLNRLRLYSTVQSWMTTDKLGSYNWGIEDVFGASTKHVWAEGVREKVSCNLSERMQGTVRQREKTLRGLDQKASGQIYMDGCGLTYNLIREHESLGGKTPRSGLSSKSRSKLGPTLWSLRGRSG